MDANITDNGYFDSPISVEMVTEKAVRLSNIVVDGVTIYWLESRPSEGGRGVICTEKGDVLKTPHSARTKVHEYGGSSYYVKDGKVVFVEYKDQTLRDLDNNVLQEGMRTTDFSGDGKHLYAVGETHSDSTENFLVLIGHGPVHQGHDFYASPRLSPDGKKLAFITWDHPNMPWDSSTLWVANVNADGTLANCTSIAGGKDCSVVDPKWDHEGNLYYSSDKSGFWNLYRGEDNLTPWEMEVGFPHWIFGDSHYTFFKDQIAFIGVEEGISSLYLLKDGKKERLDLPYSSMGWLGSTDESLVFLGSSPTSASEIVKWTDGQLKILKKSQEKLISKDFISVPEKISFPTTGGKTAYGFYYPPKNPHYKAPANAKPPLIVLSHGGPSACAINSLSLAKQFWTSRGYALLDVNYGGSTGFGREYRERLNGAWGVVDVDDCCNGARYLAEKGLVDPKRLVIKGGSSGGYTTLAALAFRDVFTAGVSLYGISDLEALARDTHKFESHYHETLIAPYPQEKELYQKRSPIHSIETFSCPLLLLQGSEDVIVPPNQSEAIYTALKEKGIYTEYHLYEGEQHGFRKEETIHQALNAELAFYHKIFPKLD
ncbi:MAG: hypothetical protein SP1CHLAM54_05830 [Chlamydiia bacterium]|nr:hypothetical protein [Chlamydiia bacterium]MCH9615493.1 hypothetical protein [Chlamydiia bacterium]MCH9629148.1 hypothetical protein [Chlamydiia bacterium]